jgi:hypothetical protein
MTWWWPFNGGGAAKTPTPPAPIDAGAASAHTLADFTRGIQHAINAALDVAQIQYHREIAEEFRKSQDSEVLLPKMQTYAIAPGWVVDLPTLTAKPMWSMQPKTMKVKMAIRIAGTSLKQMGPKERPHDATRTSFQVALAPSGRKARGASSSVVELEMTFVAGDAPEGVGRLMEYLVNALAPRAATGTPPAPPAPPVSTDVTPPPAPRGPDEAAR